MRNEYTENSTIRNYTQCACIKIALLTHHLGARYHMTSTASTQEQPMVRVHHHEWCNWGTLDQIQNIWTIRACTRPCACNASKCTCTTTNSGNVTALNTCWNKRTTVCLSTSTYTYFTSLVIHWALQTKPHANTSQMILNTERTYESPLINQQSTSRSQ